MNLTSKNFFTIVQANMAGIPENPLPDYSRGEGRLSPDAQQISVELTADTMVTLSSVLWGMTMARTMVVRTLGGTPHDEEVKADSSRLLERVQRSALAMTDVSKPIKMSLSGDEIDLLNFRLQLLGSGAYPSSSQDAKDSYISAFRDINEAFVKTGQTPRPGYADFLHGENRQ